MEVLYERVAGLDIGKATLVVVRAHAGAAGRAAVGDADVPDDHSSAGRDAGLAARARA